MILSIIHGKNRTARFTSIVSSSSLPHNLNKKKKRGEKALLLNKVTTNLKQTPRFPIHNLSTNKKQKMRRKEGKGVTHNFSLEM